MMNLDTATRLATVHPDFIALLEATGRGWVPTLRTERRGSLARMSKETRKHLEAARTVAEALEAAGRKVERRA